MNTGLAPLPSMKVTVWCPQEVLAHPEEWGLEKPGNRRCSLNSRSGCRHSDPRTHLSKRIVSKHTATGTVGSSKLTLRLPKGSEGMPSCTTRQHPQNDHKEAIKNQTIMKSRKMVPMNRFAGQQWRQTQRTDLWTRGAGRGGRRGWDIWREKHGNTH